MSIHFQVRLIYGQENRVDVPVNSKKRTMQMVVVRPLMQIQQMRPHTTCQLQLHRHHRAATIALAVLRADASVVPVHQQDADSAAWNNTVSIVSPLILMQIYRMHSSLSLETNQ